MTEQPPRDQPTVPPADAALGPELVRLDTLAGTSSGPGMLRIVVTMALFLLLALGVAAVLVVLGLLRGDHALWITGLLVGLVSATIFGATLAVAVMTLRSSLSIHGEGLALRQGIGGTRAILWRDVAELQPAASESRHVTFMAALASGRRQGISRLKLEPRRDEQGVLRRHPDVDLVLEHYARWCRQHGCRPAIRTVTGPDL